MTVSGGFAVLQRNATEATNATVTTVAKFAIATVDIVGNFSGNGEFGVISPDGLLTVEWDNSSHLTFLARWQSHIAFMPPALFLWPPGLNRFDIQWGLTSVLFSVNGNLLWNDTDTASIPLEEMSVFANVGQGKLLLDSASVGSMVVQSTSTVPVFTTSTSTSIITSPLTSSRINTTLTVPTTTTSTSMSLSSTTSTSTSTSTTSTTTSQISTEYTSSTTVQSVGTFTNVQYSTYNTFSTTTSLSEVIFGGNSTSYSEVLYTTSVTSTFTQSATSVVVVATSSTTETGTATVDTVFAGVWPAWIVIVVGISVAGFVGRFLIARLYPGLHSPLNLPKLPLPAFLRGIKPAETTAQPPTTTNVPATGSGGGNGGKRTYFGSYSKATMAALDDVIERAKFASKSKEALGKEIPTGGEPNS